jgi:nicotinate-nucleotide pyrophosphorylase (carboxylating)
MLTPLYPVQYEPLLRAALAEDLGTAGDLTSDAIVPPHLTARADVVARAPGRVAGIRVATAAFALLDPAVSVAVAVEDGADVAAGTVLATVEGAARAVLSAERVALNLLGRTCGVATATASLVAAVAGHRARIVPTRKTTPGLRTLERYAVRAGGGTDHRFGLHDGMLIKDNHILVAGGIAPAVKRARDHAGHMVKVEVEVDTLEQLEAALALGVDAILLDNMPPAMLAEAVDRVDGTAITEASGGINPTTIAAVAATGVDLISTGWITHSAPALDVALDFTVCSSAH